MKKQLSVLAVAVMLATSILAAFALDPSTEGLNLKTVQFDKEFCKTVSEVPLIAVCVGGDPTKAWFTKGTERALKTRTKKLLEIYAELAKNPIRKFSSTCTFMDWVPSECGGAATYCDAHPNDGQCPSACTYDDWHDPYCGAPTYCDAYPSDGRCPSSCTFMTWHYPYCGAATFCDAYPNDGQCPSACTFTDWHDPYCGAPTYCDAYPNDGRCPSTCTFMTWHDPYCGAPTFCDAYPNDPFCQ